MTTIDSRALSDLAGQLDGEVFTDDVTKLVYASAACIYRIEPLGVVHPKNAVDVALTVRFCRERGLPIIPRGGGSGLAGQTVGRAVIIDFTRYMDALENVDPDANTVRIQPGITHGTLNWLLEPYGKYLPPDPSSGNFATLGGMISNNSSGSHALKYGNTIDYVRKLKMVTDTGEIIDAESRRLRDLKGSGGRTPELYAGAAKIALRYAPQIESCMPKVHKNSSGYRLDRFIEHVNGGTVAHLQRLVCGSEGTLGIIVEAELDVADPPACAELLVLAFADLQSASDAVPLIMELQPSALEAMDRSATTIVRERRPELRKFLPEDAQLLLFVEFDGPEREPLVEKTGRVKRDILTKRKLAMSSIDTADAAEQQALWDVRKAVLPILANLPGPKRAIPFVEDATVPVPAVPAYMAGLKKILDAHNAAFVVLGHAGQGNFHVRPMINAGDPDEVDKMAQISEEVTDLVLSLGGTLSGEHADGLVRSQFVRRQYGELYPAFEEIKDLFDPENIFNPGKIVRPLQTMRENLKFGPEYIGGKVTVDTGLIFDDGEYERLVEKCQGCGTCRTQTPATAMCPIFKALKDERLSPRGKLSVLREMLAGNIHATPENAEQLDRVFELCLNCGMCTRECPALAEVSLLINEARVRRSGTEGVPRTKRLISMYPELARRAPDVVNKIGAWLMDTGLSRALLERLAGIDHRRELPPIRPVRKVRPVEIAEPARRVALFSDLYASLHDPEIIECALDILEHNRVDVAYPRQKEVGIVAMTAGDISRARRTVEYNLEGLIPAAQDGRTIVCTEPTAALCLKRDYRRFSGNPGAATVADRAGELFEFLLDMKNEGLLRDDFVEINDEYVYHTPCHVAAADIGQPVVDVLAAVPGLKISILTKNCCGMAGSFGVDKKHYDLSAQIGRALFDEIDKAGCRKVLTECSACKMQIEEQTGVEVVHPVKLLHRAYGL